VDVRRNTVKPENIEIPAKIVFHGEACSDECTFNDAPDCLFFNRRILDSYDYKFVERCDECISKFGYGEE
jgi:hypothetical protein